MTCLWHMANKGQGQDKSQGSEISCFILVLIHVAMEIIHMTLVMEVDGRIRVRIRVRRDLNYIYRFQLYLVWESNLYCYLCPLESSCCRQAWMNGLASGILFEPIKQCNIFMNIKKIQGLVLDFSISLLSKQESMILRKGSNEKRRKGKSSTYFAMVVNN